MLNDTFLILIAFCTSSLTAIFGLGGGMILIAFMPFFLPAPAIIPMHAATQLVSNGSRALFAWREIEWQFTLSFLLGSIVGGILAAKLATLINLHYLPLLMAAFILFNVWGGGIKFTANPKGEFLTIGFMQTGLGMLVGATGPLGQSTLVRKGLKRDEIVTTSAVFMVITHLLKLILFGFLGFSFAHYWQLTVGMIIATTLGSWFGTKIRHRVPETNFQVILKWLLTLLVLQIIYITLSST
ncbi:sulfite exporter TauE/SafE family protein [uncultured Thiothrix sp.]|uniref:sulfite exporter TauE/SafE family protein n=1 Tax=uncultured Thiothrix sp. TaxID=223185 RepID=UPI0026184AC9|nr:sulfite exporter TauE/SafE family protein [uncultured Thiothrix sp.]